MIARRVRFQNLLNGVYLFALVVLVIVALTAYKSFNTMISKAASVDHTNRVIATANQAFSFIRDAESEQRGYILSGDSTYLDTYDESIDSAKIYLDRLKILTTDNPSQQARIQLLTDLVVKKINLTQEALTLKNHQDNQGINQFYASRRGKITMDSVRTMVTAIVKEERVLLAKRDREFSRYLNTTEKALYGTITVAALAFAILFLYIRNQIKSSEAYERELKHLNEELNQTNQELTVSNEELAALSEEQITLNEELTTSHDQLEAVRSELETRVKERTAELERINQSLLKEIAQREQVEKALNNTLEELKVRNHELDNYVYKVSHDLRAPLTSILGLINLTQVEEDLESVKRYIKLIENRVNKSDEFIKSVLNHSRSLNAPIEISFIDFPKIIYQTTEELKYLTDSNKLRIITQIEGQIPFYSDELRISMIIKNITSNAIKFRNPNQEDSYLAFTIKVNEERATLTIKDNGIGINKEYINKIFDMFFRGTERSDGSGLGLYIVKQTIEKLGGCIEVDSTLGEGTTFTIELANLINQYLDIEA